MKRVAIVRSRFNETITDRLLASCLKTLTHSGISRERIEVVEVPGGWEIPWAVQELARGGAFESVIAIGCVLKGQTPQNDHLSRSLISSLHRISLETRLPVILGVITPNTMAQALARTKGDLDRGREAALAALDMMKLREKFNGT